MNGWTTLNQIDVGVQITAQVPSPQWALVNTIRDATLQTT